MRLFRCSKCGNAIYFENVRCVNCGYTLAYFPEHGLVTSIRPVRTWRRKPADAPMYKALIKEIKGKYRLCANSAAGVCNSAVSADDPEELCHDCRLNDVIPDLSSPEAREAWQSLERWKRRLLFSIQQLHLPIESRAERPKHGLMFSFMRDSPDGKQKVFTGHCDGLITINIAEADDPFREKLRKQLQESYRTVLGHFRHEIGHYYWDRLVRDTPWSPAYRRIFGDERLDYAEAVKRHYAQGTPSHWPQRFVSAYATMHPWEDWAETWAHYMHITDTLGTARSYGLVLNPRADGRAVRGLSVAVPRVDFRDFDELYTAWVPVTVALNSLNRSMGLIDPYPFVLSKVVSQKLRFVHDVVRLWRAPERSQAKRIAHWLKEFPVEPPARQDTQADNPLVDAAAT